MIPGMLPTLQGEGYLDTKSGTFHPFAEGGRMTTAIAIVSGGLDSTVLVYHMLDHDVVPHLLSFNYGQRHKKELDFARRTAEKFNLNHNIVDLSALTSLISNSALTSSDEENVIEVPDGHYAEETMKATVVPNRNMIMLSIAAGIAVNNNYTDGIWTGVHAGDHFIYPDCRAGFIKQCSAAIELANEGLIYFGGPWEAVKAPFVNRSKADIAYRGIQLGVPFDETWSCYKGGDIHCGRCGTCVERLEAIDEATSRYCIDKGLTTGGPNTVFDYTEYADTEFWKVQVANAKI